MEKYSRVDIKYYMGRSPVIVQEITYDRHIYTFITANRIKAEGFNNCFVCGNNLSDTHALYRNP